MSVALLDAGVLIALLWPPHESHQKTQKWFSAHAEKGWATCPVTQAAFVRIVSNPSFSPLGITPSDAMEVLARSLKNPLHRFWSDSIDVITATQKFVRDLTGHKRVTDAYLLGLALHNSGVLATLDQGFATSFGPQIAGTGIIVTI
jgi:uncharacterized protein